MFQAVNRVGLIAVATTSAVVVDGSPPVAGHVYDVINASHTKDIDYTVRIVFIFEVRQCCPLLVQQIIPSCITFG